MSRYPSTGIDGCCARVAMGHDAAAPPSSVMKSRRLMGTYPKARITEDYNRSELGRWRASQQKRSPMTALGRVSRAPS